ncbi:MAG: hypothetical protein R3F35_06085 [Myxococcota bacterium]
MLTGRRSPVALCLVALAVLMPGAPSIAAEGLFLARILMTTAGSFGAVLGSATNATTESTVRYLAPTACTARDLIVDFTGTTTARTVNLRVNGAATSLSCSVTAGSPTCSNTFSSVNVSRGDHLSLSLSGGAQTGLAALVSFVCRP